MPAARVFSKQLISDIEHIEAVKGLAVINSSGTAEYSSLSCHALEELIRFTGNIIPLLDSVDEFGELEVITLEAESDGFFSVMLADKRLVGVHCCDQITMLMLKQEIDNLLQWRNYPDTPGLNA